VAGQVVYRQPGLKEGAPSKRLGESERGDPDTAIIRNGIVDRQAGTITIDIDSL
jgi:hypothetical protein